MSLLNQDMEEALSEFKELALAAQATIVGIIKGGRTQPEAKYFIGPGKAEELKALVALENADLILVNHELSPSQERNLEQLLNCKVVSRSGLILDIFAQRARTFEGKLQVELAQLEHLSTRLIRGWTHQERQKGGIGLRGPGETQLETDRRLLRQRIKTIHAKLKKVRQNRDQNRRARLKAELPTVSLVGYTNAGKSTLFNALTGEAHFVANQLFATLDPAMRKIELPGAQAIILADTVGFIRDLPHALIAAFKATLEETQQASVLLHVIDIANPQWREQVQAVEHVLAEIGSLEIPSVLVFNKIDLKEDWEPQIEMGKPKAKVWISAHKRLGLDLLKEAIIHQLPEKIIEMEIYLSPQQGQLRAKLYALKAILNETLADEGGWYCKLRLSQYQKNTLFPSIPEQKHAE